MYNDEVLMSLPSTGRTGYCSGMTKVCCILRQDITFYLYLFIHQPDPRVSAVFAIKYLRFRPF